MKNIYGILDLDNLNIEISPEDAEVIEMVNSGKTDRLRNHVILRENNNLYIIAKPAVATDEASRFSKRNMILSVLMIICLMVSAALYFTKYNIIGCIIGCMILVFGMFFKDDGRTEK